MNFNFLKSFIPGTNDDIPKKGSNNEADYPYEQETDNQNNQNNQNNNADQTAEDTDADAETEPEEDTEPDADTEADNTEVGTDVDLEEDDLPELDALRISNSSSSAIQTRLPRYKKALKQYFQLKKKYQNDRRKRKKCVGCKRKVGSIFDFRDGVYVALCGNQNDACPLDIQIRRELYGSRASQLSSLKEEESKLKYDIVDLKLKYLFRMVTETEMVDTFSKLKEEFNQTFSQIEELEKTLSRETNDKKETSQAIEEATKSLEEAIQEIKSSMKEFQETQDNQHIEDAVDLYCDELHPILRSIRSLKKIKYKMRGDYFYRNKKSAPSKYLFKQRKNAMKDPDEYIMRQGEVMAFRKK